ncbi:MAG: hypothetical protein K9J42_05790 [Sulfuritalea sp.]|nr:hypothetical protein [Sulfuritalea sp.]
MTLPAQLRTPKVAAKQPAPGQRSQAGRCGAEWRKQKVGAGEMALTSAVVSPMR